MQIVGPACLVATMAVAVLGFVFLRLWRAELQRQRSDIELRARAQLEVMAADMINKRRPSSSSARHHMTGLTGAARRDSEVRRQLMLQLRRQSAVDVRYVTHGSCGLLSLAARPVRCKLHARLEPHCCMATEA